MDKIGGRETAGLDKCLVTWEILEVFSNHNDSIISNVGNTTML